MRTNPAHVNPGRRRSGVAYVMGILLPMLTFAAWHGADAESYPDMPPDAIVGRVRRSLAAAVTHLTERLEKSDEGLALEPVRQRQVVDWSMRETRYAPRTIEEPIYEYEAYETMEMVGGGSEGGTPQLQKVTRHRVKGVKGTRKRTIQVRDPNGSVIVQERVPIYGPGGPDLWTDKFLGQNALALFALLKCGKGLDDRHVAALADRLDLYLNAYGVPDTTWDVAWLAAAFAHLEGDRVAAMRRRLVERLLAAQIGTGPAKGMWGPLAIDIPTVARLLELQQKAAAEEAEADAELRRRPNSNTWTRRRTEAAAKRMQIERHLPELTQQGTRFDQAQNWATIGAGDYAGTLPSVQTHGLPYHIYTRQLADLETTALALYVLNEIRQRGHLPERLEPNDLLKEVGVKPRTTPEIIAAATEAFLARASRQATWDEGNVLQPVREFDVLKIPGTPVNEASLPVLASPDTSASTFQAYGGLLDALAAAGQGMAPGRFAGLFEAAEKGVHARIREYLGEEATGAAPQTREIPPYSHLWRVAGIRHGLDGNETVAGRLAWNALALRLVSMQAQKGTWGGGRRLFPGSSLFALKDVNLRRAHEQEQAKLPEAQRKPYDPAALWQQQHWGHHFHVDAELVGTAYAMLFLVDGLRLPVAGQWNYGTGSATSRTLPRVVTALGERHGTPLRTMNVDADIAYGQIEGLPMLVVAGAGAFPELTDSAKAAVARYVEEGGILIVEAVGDADGLAWLAQVEAALLGVFPGAAKAEVPTRAPFIRNFSGTPPPFHGLALPSGQFGAIVLPLARQASGDGLIGFADACEMLAQLILASVDPRFFERGYAMQTE